MDNYNKPIVRWDGEKIPPLSQEEMIKKYGATEEKNKVENDNLSSEYPLLSDEQLEAKFYRARERMKSDVLMDNHGDMSKADYNEYYVPLKNEMEKRGLSVAQEIESIKNTRIGSKEEYRKFGDKIVEAIEFNRISYFENEPLEDVKWLNIEDVLAIKEDVLENGTKEDLVFVETLLAQKQHMQALEDEARAAFRALLSIKKPKGDEAENLERTEAKKLWEEKRQAVIEFEKTTEKEVLVKNIDESPKEDSLTEQAA